MKNGRSVRSGHFIFDLLPAIRFKVISSPSAVALTNLRGESTNNNRHEPATLVASGFTHCSFSEMRTIPPEKRFQE